MARRAGFWTPEGPADALLLVFVGSAVAEDAEVGRGMLLVRRRSGSFLVSPRAFPRGVVAAAGLPVGVGMSLARRSSVDFGVGALALARGAVVVVDLGGGGGGLLARHCSGVLTLDRIGGSGGKSLSFGNIAGAATGSAVHAKSRQPRGLQRCCMKQSARMWPASKATPSKLGCKPSAASTRQAGRCSKP